MEFKVLIMICIVALKNIDKLQIYFTDREIAQILWFG